MSAQKNKLTIVVTLAIVSVLLLGGVSFTFFPSQTKPTSTPQLAISTNPIDQAFVPTANLTFQIIGDYSINSSLSNGTVQPVGGLAFVVSEAHPLDGIAIEPDGSINSTTAPIQRVGDTYKFTGDIVNQTLVVQKDNVVLDGGGYNLVGFGHGFAYAFEAIALQGVKNVTVENFNITSFWQPVQVRDSVNVKIKANNLTDCPSVAISLASCNNSVIENNILTGTIYIENVYGDGESTNNSIIGNTISNVAEGIQIYGSNHNVITGNILTNVYDSIGVSGNSTVISNNIIVNGIEGIYAGGDATVFGNFISNVTDAGLAISDQNNRVYENTVENAKYGVWLQASGYNASGNTIFYHNNFVNNTLNVQFDPSTGVVHWDNGQEGNYWSNYNGTDADKDGLGDMPFQIGDNNTDLYPLMQPYAPLVNSYDHVTAQLFFTLAGVAAACGVFVALTWAYFGKRTVKKKLPHAKESIT